MLSVWWLTRLTVILIAGGWTKWSAWSACSKTCGCGSQSRTRKCKLIPAAIGGTGCGGISYTIRKCNDKPCPMWSDWSSFSPCTCSCGGGTQAQTRVCNRLPKELGGTGCTGKHTRFRVCNKQVCSPCLRAPPLGKKLPNSIFTASSSFGDSKYNHKTAKLDSQNGWCPARRNVPHQYLQINLKAVHAVCAIATQGHKTTSSHWTTRYSLATSTDGRTWKVYKKNNTAKVFSGNSDNNSVVKHVLPALVTAQYIRFIPTAHAGFPCLRVEVYGYKL